MPELPEVETIRRGLHRRLGGRRILSTTLWETRFRVPIARAKMETLVGHRVREVGRRGKYLLVGLDDARVWLMHLGMSGRILLDRRDGARGSHEHLRVRFEGGAVLHLVDPRRFGKIRLGRYEDMVELARLGPEPQDAEPRLVDRLRKTRRQVKAALLDQSLVAGVGNIYANEILFRAGVRPQRRGHRLRRAEVIAIASAVREVLAEAVSLRGTSFSDYFDPDGRRGSFQQKLSVFQRGGEPCVHCGDFIRQLAQGGRSSFYCPTCQS